MALFPIDQTFRPANSGTSEDPIWFVGNDGADIRSGATVALSGWPALADGIDIIPFGVTTTLKLGVT